MIKLSDYLFLEVARRGVKHVFMVSGGGAMHLVDSVGHTPGLEFVANHHEQASAIAAETYGKYTNNLGVALVTTGPGGTNTITGVVGAWQDSTPCLFISGQVKRADLIGQSGVRQMGMQEVDIVTLVSSITKYAVTIMDPLTIRYHLEKALYLAKSGRPGPVWIDIPLDIQAAMIDPDALPGFPPPEETIDFIQPSLKEQVTRVFDLLNQAERPIILAGNGIRLAHAQSEFEDLINRLGIPVLLTWLAPDLLPYDHPLLVGRPGSTAPRGVNFALQNADFLLVIGSRLDMVLTGYSHVNYARAAKKVMIDIDPAEIRKMQCPIEIPICRDAGNVLRALLRQSDLIKSRNRSSWMIRCQEWKTKYPVVLPEYRENTGSVSSYVLADLFSEELTSDDVIVSGSSGVAIEIFQLALRMKRGQRLLHTTALGAMGFGLPTAIAAALASDRRVIAVDGDGSFHFNIQELETLQRLQLPIKYFILCNEGYASIRAMQRGRFGRLVACDASSGVTLPSFQKIAAAYGLATAQITDQMNLREQIREILATPATVICEVTTTPDEPRRPSLASVQRPDGSIVSNPLEDLSPLLERKEFLENMIIPPIED